MEGNLVEEKNPFKIFALIMITLFFFMTYSYQIETSQKMGAYRSFIRENTYIMSKYYDEFFKKAEVELEDKYYAIKLQDRYREILTDYNFSSDFVLIEKNPGQPIIMLVKEWDSYKLKIERNIYERGVFKGVASAIIDMDAMDFGNENEDGIRYKYILDERGTIIAHDNWEFVGMNLDNIQERYIRKHNMTPEQIESISSVWDQINENKNFGELEYEAPLGCVMGSYKKLDSMDIYVVSVFDQKGFSSQMFKSLMNSMAFLIVGSIIIMVALFSYIINLCNRDNMLGFYNEGYMQRILKRKRKKHGGDVYFTVFKLDSINDKNGNSIVDSEISGVFAKNMRKKLKSKYKNCKIGRLSHNKFVIFFNDMSQENTKRGYTGLKNALKYGFSSEEEDFRTNGSGHIVCIPKDCQCQNIIDNIIRYSELNGFENSLKEINYTDIEAFLQDNIKKRDIIITAMQEDRIVPFYQPIYDSLEDKVVKYEVLMRIKEGDQYLSPFPFIKVAEKFGIINKLDEMVIRKALRYKHELKKMGQEINLSLNLSAKDLNLNFISKVVNEIRAYNLSFKDFTFEITETVALEDLDSIVDIIDTIRRMGFKVSIDDFGTGFSNINHLKKLNIDYIKIDGVFIRDLEKDEKSKRIVQAFRDMAAAFNVDIIAEFVESQEIREILDEMGISKHQGYHIGKPQEKII